MEWIYRFLVLVSEAISDHRDIRIQSSVFGKGSNAQMIAEIAHFQSQARETALYKMLGVPKKGGVNLTPPSL